MIADRCRTLHPDFAFARDLCELNIEIVQHFDVVAEKTERHHDRCARIEVSDRFGYVRLEPRLARTAAAALIRELPRFSPE